MANAGIAIDPWKREIFERHLAQAGYAFKNVGLVAGCMIIIVETEDLQALHHVLQRATAEAVIANN